MTTLKRHELNQFTGTTCYYQFFGKGLVITDGAKYLAENGCHWLLIAIASHQIEPKVKQYEDTQYWSLENNKENNDFDAKLICRDYEDNILVQQEIPFTDFPFDDLGDVFQVLCAPTMVSENEVGRCIFLLSEN